VKQTLLSQEFKKIEGKSALLIHKLKKIEAKQTRLFQHMVNKNPDYICGLLE
jgi:hypothetical protein